jgi:hypothetical protein
MVRYFLIRPCKSGGNSEVFITYSLGDHIRYQHVLQLESEENNDSIH